MDPFDAVDVAHAEFERRLRLVRADQWADPTPCSEWSVRDLVNHV
ncbi:MAG: maleylpyruvate isomerase N-terminal domain-containing protein, partial [Vicinamibacterales bacterium]